MEAEEAVPEQQSGTPWTAVFVDTPSLVVPTVEPLVEGWEPAGEL